MNGSDMSNRIDYLWLFKNTKTKHIMTRQSKINRLEKSGKKVVFSMGSGNVIVVTNNGLRSNSFNSINEAHKYYYGY
jgi:hypothetical protein